MIASLPIEYQFVKLIYQVSAMFSKFTSILVPMCLSISFVSVDLLPPIFYQEVYMFEIETINIKDRVKG